MVHYRFHKIPAPFLCPQPDVSSTCHPILLQDKFPFYSLPTLNSSTWYLFFSRPSLTKIHFQLLTRSGNWVVQNGQPWAAPSSCDWGWTPAQDPSSWWTVFWRGSWKRAATCPHGWLDAPARPLPRSLGPERIRTCTAEHLTSPQGAAWACSLVDASFETRLVDLDRWSLWEDANCTACQVHFDVVTREIRDDVYKSGLRLRSQWNIAKLRCQ